MEKETRSTLPEAIIEELSGEESAHIVGGILTGLAGTIITSIPQKIPTE